LAEKQPESRWDRFKAHVSDSPISSLAADIAIAGSILGVFGVGWKLVLIIIEAIKLL
jgi:hypothetical protein